MRALGGDGAAARATVESVHRLSRSAVLRWSLSIRTTIALGIAMLMVAKPDLGESLAVGRTHQ
jgi:hypothetical protein